MKPPGRSGTLPWVSHVRVDQKILYDDHQARPSTECYFSLNGKRYPSHLGARNIDQLPCKFVSFLQASLTWNWW